MKPMRLQGVLKLYTVLYFLGFLLTFLISVPMLYHTMPRSECLLFITPRKEYGSPIGCSLVGFIPLLIAAAAVVLMFYQIRELINLKQHLQNPQVTSSEYRIQFESKFKIMMIVHCVVTVVILSVGCIITSGYVTSCVNLFEQVNLDLRFRLDYERTALQATEVKHEQFADDYRLNRYGGQTRDYLGRNKFEESITCRAMFTDPEIHLELQKSHSSNQLYERYYGQVWKQTLGDPGNMRHKAYQDNLILEISMAGSWISFALWIVMIGLMWKAKHHLKAPITEESMWGGSEYGGRKSQLMSPIDDRLMSITNGVDRMSEAGSRISYDRASRVSRGSRGSRGTSYKDMGGGGRTPKGSNSYKSMGGGRKTGSKPQNPQVAQLTISKVQQAPTAKAYTMEKYLTENASLNSLDMTVDTLQGAIIGPTAGLMDPQPVMEPAGRVAGRPPLAPPPSYPEAVAYPTGGGGGRGGNTSLLDYFSSPPVTVPERDQEPMYSSVESGVM